MVKYSRPGALIKSVFTFLIFNILVLSISHALEIRRVYVTDQSGNARANFTNSEKVNFNVRVYNQSAGDRVSFKFEVYDPSGAKKFTQTGNSIPGSAGEGGSAVSYIPIGNFYTTSGNYKLVVTANDLKKEVVFSVYSPNVTLTYPANGMRDLTDKPLTFRWVASGASKYRIYVDDDAAFFNCIFKDETIMTQYAYPAEPTDVRQKLNSGVVYYWKVEALDSAGNTIAFTPMPFSFTIKGSVLPPTAKDIAVTDIAYFNQQVGVSIKNQGGKAESGIPVILYLAGKPQGSENIAVISAGETKIIKFTPTVFGNVVAMAMITFEDDYIKNNIMTKQINIPAPVIPSSGTVYEKGSIHGSVTDEAGKKLGGSFVSYDSKMTQGRVTATPGGEYKIADLAPGAYNLTAEAEGYESASQKVNVVRKPVTNVDFRLVKKAVEEQQGPPTVFDAPRAWEALKKHVKDREILKELEGYEPVGIEGEADLEKLLKELESGDAKITGVDFRGE